MIKYYFILSLIKKVMFQLCLVVYVVSVVVKIEINDFMVNWLKKIFHLTFRRNGNFKITSNIPIF